MKLKLNTISYAFLCLVWVLQTIIVGYITVTVFKSEMILMIVGLVIFLSSAYVVSGFKYKYRFSGYVSFIFFLLWGFLLLNRIIEINSGVSPYSSLLNKYTVTYTFLLICSLITSIFMFKQSKGSG
jgi:hypothetical protein